jgi:hypothetical protein
LRDQSGNGEDPSGLTIETSGARLPLELLQGLEAPCEGVSADGEIALGLVPYGPTSIFDRSGGLVGSFNHMSPSDRWLLRWGRR